MTIYETIILNIILIYFPLFLDFFYRIFNNSINKKINTIILDITIITSFYLVLRFGGVYNLNISIFLLNIPLLISYLNKKNNLAIILSTIIVIYNYKYFNIPLYIGIISYSLYYYLFVKKLSIKKNLVIAVFSLLNILIINIYSFINNVYNYSIHDYISFIFLSFSLFILSYFTVVIHNCSNKAISFNKSLQDLEREKQLRMSLFQITHEIKNPITVCKGYLDMFDVNNSEHAKKYIPILKSEIKRVLILIEDYLSITKLKIDKEVIDITMLLEENRQNFMPLLNSKKIKYDFDYPKDEVYILADYNRLNQVLINLIKNSIEASSNNNYINVSLKVEDKDLKIVVKDNGKGMSDEELKKISKPFFTTKTSGTGLGLYLCSEIIKAHNGVISYSSKKGYGTTVTVTLPYKKDVSFS